MFKKYQLSQITTIRMPFLITHWMSKIFLQVQINVHHRMWRLFSFSGNKTPQQSTPSCDDILNPSWRRTRPTLACYSYYSTPGNVISHVTKWGLSPKWIIVWGDRIFVAAREWFQIKFVTRQAHVALRLEFLSHIESIAYRICIYVSCCNFRGFAYWTRFNGELEMTSIQSFFAIIRFSRKKINPCVGVF